MVLRRDTGIVLTVDAGRSVAALREAARSSVEALPEVAPEPAADPFDVEAVPTPELPDGRASRAVWKAYVDAVGIEVAEDATKAEIRAAVNAALEGIEG